MTSMLFFSIQKKNEDDEKKILINRFLFFSLFSEYRIGKRAAAFNSHNVRMEP